MASALDFTPLGRTDLYADTRSADAATEGASVDVGEEPINPRLSENTVATRARRLTRSSPARAVALTLILSTGMVLIALWFRFTQG